MRESYKDAELQWRGLAPKSGKGTRDRRYRSIGKSLLEFRLEGRKITRGPPTSRTAEVATVVGG